MAEATQGHSASAVSSSSQAAGARRALHWFTEPQLLPAGVGAAPPCLAGQGGGGIGPVWQRGALAVLMGLAVLLILSYDLPFFNNNAASAAKFFFSAHFLFFCAAAICLSLPWISGRWYELAVFVLAACYLFLFYGDYLLLVHMSGDSVCQVAYWNILFHPLLTGSLGVAFAKPGQVIFLGLLHQLSLLGGHIIFKVGLCLVMAACVWSLAAVATELGGRAAGIMAFFLSLWAFQGDFVLSGSAIYAITTVFAGLRFYFYHPRWRWAGRLLLVLAIQFRIEAIAVLAVMWLLLLVRRDWRELAIFSAWALTSLLIFTAIILKIQGSFARLNSGAAVGYVGPVLSDGQMDPALEASKIAYIGNTIAAEFSGNYAVRFLLLLVLAGLAGVLSHGGWIYVSALASLVVVTANVFLFGGTFNLERYCDLIYAFGCSVGVGSLTRYAGIAVRRGKAPALAGICAAMVVLLAGFDYSRLQTYQELDPASASEFFISAMAILTDEKVPEGTRLMSEDDLLSHLLVIAPDRYPSVTSLQLFNVASDEQRRAILARTDFIWFDLNRFPYYYLYHLARAEWRADPFRLMVQSILEGKSQSPSLYGVRFVPLDISVNRLLLKVER